MTETKDISWDDTVLPFQLDNSDIRGRVARLDGVLDNVLRQHNYPPVIEALVAEAAVLTALAYVRSDPRALLEEAAGYLPQRSEYAAVVAGCLETVKAHTDPTEAWRILDERYEQYNWIHAYPNIAADILALWYGGGDMTNSFSLLAHAGLDVDCNAGLVGTVLGVMNGVPQKWSEPLGDLLETYLKGKERLSIRELAARTARLARL